MTRPIHEALHRDFLLGRLLHPNVSLAEFLAALRVLHSFFRSVEVERCRMKRWRSLSVAAVVRALDDDLDSTADHAVHWRLENPMELLGGLYVAHGASFGRNVLRGNITRALPEVPQAFLQLSGPVRQWAELTAALEDFGQAPGAFEGIRLGADKSFALVASLAAAERKCFDSGD